MTFEEQEVEPPRDRGQLTRLLLALLGAGVLAGIIVLIASFAIGGFAQTEAGGCRTLPAPCTALSLASVEAISGADLPDGSEVVTAYYQRLGDSEEFRAEVRLPAGSSDGVLAPPYEPLPGDWPDTVPAVVERGLADVRYWWDEQGDGANRTVAAGEDNGRTVLLFDTRVTG